MQTKLPTKEISCHFDKESHTYKINNLVVPSVTQILTEYFDFRHSNELNKSFGTEMHEQFYHAIVSNEAKTDFQNNLLTFFKKLFKSYEVMLAEKPLFSAKYLFGGTPDLFIKTRERNFLIEFKTYTPSKKYIALQLAGQSILLKENLKKEPESFVQIIYEKGEIKKETIAPREIENAKKIFIAMLEVYWRNQSIKKFFGVNI